MDPLDHELQAVLASGVPGVISVVATQDSVRAVAAGAADAKGESRLTPEHRFRIGSVTKTFVAAVVLQLVAEGQLELDEEVGSVVDGATIRQLLNHTSGLPEPHDDVEAWLAPYRVDFAHRSESSPSEVLRSSTSRPRLFEPGHGWCYSTSNYVALGLIVEEATGMPAAEAIRVRVVEPLGLRATDLPDAGLPVLGLAGGSLPARNPFFPGRGEGLVDVTPVDLGTWTAGGMIATAPDLARFLRGLLGGELVPPELRTELLTAVRTDWEESDAYGLGIERITSLSGRVPLPGAPVWGHVGLLPGYTTVALSSEAGDRQVVVMANTSPLRDDIWDALGSLVAACFERSTSSYAC